MLSIKELLKFVNGISSIWFNNSVNGIGLGVGLIVIDGLCVLEGLEETVTDIDGDAVSVVVGVFDSDGLHDCVDVLVRLGLPVNDWVWDGVDVCVGVGVIDDVRVPVGDTVDEGVAVAEGVFVDEGVAV